MTTAHVPALALRVPVFGMTITGSDMLISGSDMHITFRPPIFLELEERSNHIIGYARGARVVPLCYIPLEVVIHVVHVRNVDNVHCLLFLTTSTSLSLGI